jgi:hypothetical protein
MKRGRLLFSGTVSLFWACAAGLREPGVAADLALRGGAIYTVDTTRRWAEAVAIRSGKIVAVGSDREIARWIGEATTTIDLEGRMVLPGFHDSHVHPVTGGIERNECDLNGIRDVEGVLDAIRRYAQAHPEAPWIRGGGWDLPLFEDGNPSRTLLDSVAPDRPAALSAADGHSLWVNSKALAIAGVDRNTPDPPDGRIERDPATGEPTGTLREGAMRLVSRHLPRHTPEEVLAGAREGLRIAESYGITSLFEASASEAILEAYGELDRRGELTARVRAAISIDPEDLEEEIPRAIELRRRFRGKRLRADAVKIFADGVIEARTAAMLEPYADRPGDRGPETPDAETLARAVEVFDREGFQVHVHAIGDRAVRWTLDAIERARRSNGERDARPVVAHVQVIHPDDRPRFRALGAIASFQPLWAYPDPYITELTVPALGPERSSGIYPIGSVARAGATLAFGSDWSVTSMNPLEGIQVAVTRRDPSASQGPAWLPDERIDLARALRAYTLGSAFAAFSEASTGSIEVGKAADLVVLDRNLFGILPSEIGRARALLTLIEGDVVWSDPAFGGTTRTYGAQRAAVRLRSSGSASGSYPRSSP